MDKNVEDVRTTQLQIRIREDLKEDLKVVAELNRLSLSATIHFLTAQAVHKAKEENPEAFGATIPPHRSRYDVYAEYLDGDDLSYTEWQYMEQSFKRLVIEHRAFKERVKQEQTAIAKEETARQRAEVIGRIEPEIGASTRADAQRMIDAADIGATGRQKRRKKTG